MDWMPLIPACAGMSVFVSRPSRFASSVPAGGLLALHAGFRVGLLELRDAAAIAIVHRLVHACAVFLRDLRSGALLALVVGDALRDPFPVVGGLGDHRLAPEHGSDHYR